MYRRRSERVTCGDEALCVFGGYELDHGPEGPSVLKRTRETAEESSRRERTGEEATFWNGSGSIRLLQCVHCNVYMSTHNEHFTPGWSYLPSCLSGLFCLCKGFKHVYLSQCHSGEQCQGVVVIAD